MGIYEEGIKRIARMYVERLEQKKSWDYLKLLLTTKSILVVLVDLYECMVKEGKCERIEKLTEEENNELIRWSVRLTMSDDFLVIKKGCKALHGFGSFIISEDESKSKT